MQASAALTKAISKVCPSLASVDLFVADIGPGSFIGVRVGVTLAKALAWCYGKPCAGVSAFDLIAPNALVAFPSKRGEYFVRDGSRVSIATEPPVNAIGFGPHFETPTYPDPARAGLIWNDLRPVDPAHLIPDYVLEPSISTPKTPYATSGTS